MFVGYVDVVAEPKSKYRVKCAQRVPPADLFPFGVGAARIADWHLEQTRFALGEFDRDLRLEPKIVAHQRNRLKQRGADRLVARPHVSEIEVGNKVAQEREESVSQLMPVHQDSPDFGSGEP